MSRLFYIFAIELICPISCLEHYPRNIDQKKLYMYTLLWIIIAHYKSLQTMVDVEMPLTLCNKRRFEINGLLI